MTGREFNNAIASGREAGRKREAAIELCELSENLLKLIEDVQRKAVVLLVSRDIIKATREAIKKVRETNRR